MNRPLLILCTLTSLSLFGFICKSKGNAVPMVADKTAAGNCLPLLQLKDGSSPPKGQKWLITKAELKGEQLLIAGRSGGICGTHNINLYWDGTFLESEPPQVDLFATHTGEGSGCKAMSEYKACIDVSYVSGSSLNIYNAFEKKIYKSIEADTIADEHKSY